MFLHLFVCLFVYPHCRLMPPLQGTPANIRLNFRLPETYYSHCATHSQLIICIDLYSNIDGWLQKRMYFKTECVMAVQGDPRSLILVAVKSMHATSY